MSTDPPPAGAPDRGDAPWSEPITHGQAQPDPPMTSVQPNPPPDPIPTIPPTGTAMPAAPAEAIPDAALPNAALPNAALPNAAVPDAPVPNGAGSNAAGSNAAGSWMSSPAQWPAPDPALVVPAAPAHVPPYPPQPGILPHPPGQGYPPPQAYPPVPNYPPPQGYHPAQGYQPVHGYPTVHGYQPAQGYQPVHGNPQPEGPSRQQPASGTQPFAAGAGWSPGRAQPPAWGPPDGGPPGHWTTAPPPSLSGYPQPVPPSRGWGWLIALLAIGAVVIALVAVVALPMLTGRPGPGGSRTAAPSAPATRAPTTAAPTPRPTATAKPKPTLPTDPKDLLKKNPIYKLKLPSRCPYQRIPASPAAFRTQVRKLVDCENAAWKKALGPTAVTFRKPEVKFYTSSVKSPCGKLGTAFPASYCTGDSTLYFSRAAYLQGRYYRLSVASFVIHEYAHHVQFLAGIFGSTGAMKESSALTSRRIELQAHCMAHYGLTVSGVGFNARDNREVEYQFGFSNDVKGHGSTTAERYWGRRGLAASTIGECNTWSAKASRVK